jgi:hypothetical protein
MTEGETLGTRLLARQKKIFVPRFYAIAMQNKYVCPTSVQLKKSMCPSSFAPAPYKINFAWPLIRDILLTLSSAIKPLRLSSCNPFS